MGKEIRETLFKLNMERLITIGQNAIVKGYTLDTIAVICIDVDDPTWTEYVDLLMPGHDWQWYRDRGMKPVAKGSVLFHNMIRVLSLTIPDITSILQLQCPEGCIWTIVLADGGWSVYFLSIAKK